jgi:predicted dehydrogenase
VHGEASVGRSGVDEHFAGTLRFGDIVATFQCGLTSRLVDQIEVIGADGVLRVPNAFVSPPGIVVLNGEEHRVEPGNAYGAELEDVCAAIRGEREVLLGREEMRNQARALARLLEFVV